MIGPQSQHTQGACPMKDSTSAHGARVDASDCVARCCCRWPSVPTAQTPLQLEPQPRTGRHRRTPQHAHADPAAVRRSHVPPPRAAMPLAPASTCSSSRRWRRQLVADQRVPGLAMAIVQNGRILSARGYGITDVTRAAAGRRAHRVPPGVAVEGLRRHHDRPAGHDGALRWDSRLTDYMPDFQLSRPGAAQQVTVADVLSHRVGLTAQHLRPRPRSQRRLPQR